MAERREEAVVDRVAEWLMRNAGLLERPGYQRHDTWHFHPWSQLREIQREPWREKARSLLSVVDDARGKDA